MMKVQYIDSVPVTVLSLSTERPFISLYRLLYPSNIVEFSTTFISIWDMSLHYGGEYNRRVHDNNYQPLFPVRVYPK
jgi:hypothetical protein